MSCLTDGNYQISTTRGPSGCPTVAPLAQEKTDEEIRLTGMRRAVAAALSDPGPREPGAATNKYNADIARAWAMMATGQTARARQLLEDVYQHILVTGRKKGHIFTTYDQKRGKRIIRTGTWGVRAQIAERLQSIINYEAYCQVGDVLSIPVADSEVLVTDIVPGEYGVTFKTLRPYELDNGTTGVERYEIYQRWDEDAHLAFAGYTPQEQPLSHRASTILAEHTQED